MGIDTMIDFQGLGGKLKTLIDRLTATRAALLDNLDAAISTRAPAATALSNATWTSELASSLASAIRLDRAEILYISGATGAGAGQKNVDVTISAVTLGKAFAFVTGGFTSGMTPATAMARFTTPTNLHITYVNPNATSVAYSFTVVVVSFA